MCMATCFSVVKFTIQPRPRRLITIPLLPCYDTSHEPKPPGGVTTQIGRSLDRRQCTCHLSPPSKVLLPWQRRHMLRGKYMARAHVRRIWQTDNIFNTFITNISSRPRNAQTLAEFLPNFIARTVNGRHYGFADNITRDHDVIYVLVNLVRMF